jgi:hypothetical protein
LVIIFDESNYFQLQSKIARCISEGLCKEDQDFPKQNIWKEQWQKVKQLLDRQDHEYAVALFFHAIECEENQNSDFKQVVTESKTFAEQQTEQSCTGASPVQRAQTTGATESSEKVRAVQVHGSDQNGEIFIPWLEIMYVISAKKSIAEMKKQELKKKKMMILIRPWNKIVEKVAQVREKVSEKNQVAQVEKCKGRYMTSEWSQVLENVTDIEKKLLEKSEEEADSKHADDDQTSDWDNIFEKSGDILFLLESAGKIGRAKTVQLAKVARNKNKEAVLGEMEIEIEESEDDGYSDSDSDPDSDSVQINVKWTAIFFIVLLHFFAYVAQMMSGVQLILTILFICICLFVFIYFAELLWFTAKSLLIPIRFD